MGDEWCKCDWGDIVTLMYGKALSGYKGTPGKYPVYGTNGPIGWHDDFLCSHPGVIVGRKGAYRGIHFSQKPFFVIDTAFYIEPKCELDLRWVYYKLLTYDINAMDSGSAIPSTSRDSFCRLPVTVPPIQEQRTIAAVLSVLDDKIELNRQMNKTLEEMAQAIFKEWFVDFGPFRDGGMQDSELGPIPVGWSVGTLGELSTLSTENCTPAKSPDKTYWHYSIPAYDKGKRPLVDKGQNIKSNKYVVDFRCLLVSKLNPEIKRIWRPCHNQDAICSTEFMVFRPISLAHKEFVHSHLDSDAFFSFLGAHASGSTGSRQRVRPRDSLNFALAIPPEDIIFSFASFVAPLHTMIQNNIDNSATLSEIRDILLPKLMSGEIRVPVAEESA